MQQMTLAEIIQDIHAMDEELWHYESRYGLRTRYFIELYQAGELRYCPSFSLMDFIRQGKQGLDRRQLRRELRWHPIG